MSFVVPIRSFSLLQLAFSLDKSDFLVPPSLISRQLPPLQCRLFSASLLEYLAHLLARHARNVDGLVMLLQFAKEVTSNLFTTKLQVETIIDGNPPAHGEPYLLPVGVVQYLVNVLDPDLELLQGCGKMHHGISNLNVKLLPIGLVYIGITRVETPKWVAIGSVASPCDPSI